MAETKTKVNYGKGLVDGQKVPITETTERWTDVLLEDGTKLRLKPNVVGVVRVDGQYDPEGNPVYAIQTAIVMTIVSVLPSMRQAAVAGKAN